MKNYGLAGLLAAGIATAMPNYAPALETDFGGPCVRAPNSMCMAPLLMERYDKNTATVRLVVEQWFDKDIYRVLLKEGDTLKTALQIVKKARPEASIDDLVRENKLKKKKLPSPKKTKDGEVEYGSVTYTVNVTPTTPTQ